MIRRRIKKPSRNSIRASGSDRYTRLLAFKKVAHKPHATTPQCVSPREQLFSGEILDLLLDLAYSHRRFGDIDVQEKRLAAGFRKALVVNPSQPCVGDECG